MGCAQTNKTPIEEILDNPQLSEVIGSVDSLPTLPRIYTELTHALADPEISLQAIARIVEQDMGMCAKILHLVNSAYFGFRQRVTSMTTAVSLLGSSMLRSLALSVAVFRVSGTERLIPGFSLESEQAHALLTARVSKELLDDELLAEDTFTTGMLHDVGKLVLVEKCPDLLKEAYKISRREGRPLHEVEVEVIGVNHADTGAYLLNAWDIPESVVTAVAFHHNPAVMATDDIDILAAVHIADALIRTLNQSQQGSKGPAIDPCYMERDEVSNSLEKWMTIAWNL